MAVKFVIAVYKLSGTRAASAQAQALVQAGAGADVAGLAGSLALELGELEQAKAMLEISRSSRGPMGLADILEWQLSSATDDQQGHRQVLQKFLARRDLPPMLSKMVGEEQVWSWMLSGELVQAGALASRLVAIDSSIPSELALWAIALHKGDESAARLHLARTSEDAARQLWFMSLGYHCIRRPEQAAETLGQLRQLDAMLAERAAQFLAVEAKA